MLTTPPSASVPKPTGTTPRYTSMRSAKFTGRLFRSRAVPAPSCGTPSMNTFTWRPEKPSSMSCMSEPTPPVSRSLTPGTAVRASARFLFSPAMPLRSSATALKAERLTRATWLASTFTSASSMSRGRILTLIFLRSPAVRVTVCSTVSYPMALNTRVWMPASTCR